MFFCPSLQQQQHLFLAVDCENFYAVLQIYSLPTQTKDCSFVTGTKKLCLATTKPIFNYWQAGRDVYATNDVTLQPGTEVYLNISVQSDRSYGSVYPNTGLVSRRRFFASKSNPKAIAVAESYYTDLPTIVAVCNPTNEPITLDKGSKIADFTERKARIKGEGGFTDELGGSARDRDGDGFEAHSEVIKSYLYDRECKQSDIFFSSIKFDDNDCLSHFDHLYISQAGLYTGKHTNPIYSTPAMVGGRNKAGTAARSRESGFEEMDGATTGGGHLSFLYSRPRYDTIGKFSRD